MKRSCALLVATAFVLFCPGSSAWAEKKLLQGIPLVWKPTDLGKMGTVNLTGITETKIQIAGFTEGRQDPGKIAENQEDEKGKVLPVTTSGNVPEFCATNTGTVLRTLGLNVVKDGGDVTLTGEVLQFFVVEKNTYIGDVRIKMTLTGKDGKALWTGMATGSSKRFGRSYKAENYYEVLSDSLLSAAGSIVSDEGFRKALGAK